MNGPETLRCARHPDVETTLRCGKCGTPICPRCMVQTPVGARCPDCARLYKLPTFRVSGAYYLRAAGAALGMAIVIGVVWGLIESHTGWIGMVIKMVIGYASGYAIGEVTSLSVNRKRGPWLAAIGGLAVLICWAIVYLMGILVWGIFIYKGIFIFFSIVAVAYGIFVAVNRLR